MSLRDDIIRHQLLLMRLVRTQAKETKKILNKAYAFIVEAIRTGNYLNLQAKLEAVMGAMPGTAMKLVNELAWYEANFTKQRLARWNKELKIKGVLKQEVLSTAETVNVAVNIDRTPQTIANTYKLYAAAVISRSLLTISDKQITLATKEETTAAIKEKFQGMFTVQNLALAGVAIIGVANAVRGLVTEANGMQLEWSAILDESTCNYCEEQDGEIFDTSEESLIPAHANCRCTWLIVNE